MSRAAYLKERTNLRTIVVALAMLLLGVGFLILSEALDLVSQRVWLKAIVANLGGLLVATISIAILWELFSKRALLDELLSKADLAEDVRSMGVVGLTLNPLQGPAFSQLIRGTNKLDIFVCYANTWRATFESDLKAMAHTPNACVRLIVPDPDDTFICQELARRFNALSGEELSSRIQTAIKEFKAVFLSVKNPSLDFSVWLHKESPVSSFYRFDNVAVLTLYK